MQLLIESDHAVQEYIEALLSELPINAASHQVSVSSSADSLASNAAASPSVGEVKEAVGLKAPAALDHTPGEARSAAAERSRNTAFVKHLEAAQEAAAQKMARRVVRPAALAAAPAWVLSEQLPCLTFKIANLKLALPLQYLAKVEPFAGADAISPASKVSNIAEQSNWQNSFVECCLGEVDDRVIVDTAKLVMPERYDNNMVSNYRQVLLIRDMDWCFAVDSIGGEMDINVSEVRWRSQHTRREWLAGTIIEKMCAIVDADALHRLLLAASVLGDDADSDLEQEGL